MCFHVRPGASKAFSAARVRSKSWKRSGYLCALQVSKGTASHGNTPGKQAAQAAACSITGVCTWKDLLGIRPQPVMASNASQSICSHATGCTDIQACLVDFRQVCCPNLHLCRALAEGLLTLLGESAFHAQARATLDSSLGQYVRAKNAASRMLCRNARKLPDI